MKMPFELVFIVTGILITPKQKYRDKITTVAVTRKSDFKKNNSAESPRWMFSKKTESLI
jgi:hypothetical protein